MIYVVDVFVVVEDSIAITLRVFQTAATFRYMFAYVFDFVRFFLPNSPRQYVNVSPRKHYIYCTRNNLPQNPTQITRTSFYNSPRCEKEIGGKKHKTQFDEVNTGNLRTDSVYCPSLRHKNVFFLSLPAIHFNHTNGIKNLRQPLWCSFECHFHLIHFRIENKIKTG